MGFINFNNVYYAYQAGTSEEVRALQGVSFEINEGDFVALVGHNGSGKSTIARLMNGLFTPLKGSVTVDGMDTKDKGVAFEIRKRVGLVFQNPDNQMVASIIEDDVAFGPENLGLDRAEIRARVDWALDAVGMGAHAKGTPFRLSGGQKQRIAIAGVLALKPRVMVLDESTAMLDPKGRAEVLAVVDRLRREENITVILITHFLEEALFANKVIVLNGGKIVMEGGKEVLTRADELSAIGLDVPFAASVANQLRARGLPVNGDILSQEELLAELKNRAVLHSSYK